MRNGRIEEGEEEERVWAGGTTMAGPGRRRWPARLGDGYRRRRRRWKKKREKIEKERENIGEREEKERETNNSTGGMSKSLRIRLHRQTYNFTGMSLMC